MSAAINSMFGRRGHQASVRRFLLTLVCLVAFSFQSYVAQTHIHASGETGPAVASGQLTHDHKPATPSDDPVRCPQCQMAFLAGAAVPPDALIFIIPIHSFFSGYLADTARHIQSVASHAWEIRGPPQH